MSTRDYISSRVAIISALLEHAGHLSERLSELNIHTFSFPECVRYIVYRFFHESSRSLFVKEITKSSLYHQTHLQSDSPLTEIPRPKWITLQCDTSKIDVDEQWSSWTPDEFMANTIKTSVDKILCGSSV